MNSLEWLQNLKQHSTPIGAFCGKKFDHESQPFYRYGFPPVTQFFDSRTVYEFHLFKTIFPSSRGRLGRGSIKVGQICCMADGKAMTQQPLIWVKFDADVFKLFSHLFVTVEQGVNGNSKSWHYSKMSDMSPSPHPILTLIT